MRSLITRVGEWEPASRQILTRAATTGAMVANFALGNRFDKCHIWPDRRWERIILTTTPGSETPGKEDCRFVAEGCQFAIHLQA